MHSGLIFKIAFWLIIIGAAALLTPNPAWPEWVARMTLSTGIALAVTALLLPFIQRRKNAKRDK